MVKRWVSFFGKEISGLHEAAYLLGAFAILSQLLALIRDRLLAHQFGASASLDIYYASFRIPDFLFATIASLFSASIIIPFLAGELKEGKGREFLNSITTVFIVMMVVASIAAFFLIPLLVPVLFPGFTDPLVHKQLSLLSQILLLSPILLGLSNLIASVTQLNNRFLIYAISPLLYNCGIIFGAIFLTSRFGITGLVYGVILGALMHLLIQVPYVYKQGLLPRLNSFTGSLSRVKDVLIVAVPRTLSLSAQEITKFFLIALASGMGVGSIAVFNFSFNLQSVPLSIIGVSYSLAAFPTLTKYFSSGDSKKFIEHLTASARHIIFLSVPLLVLFIVLRAQIVRVILGSGAFSWADTKLTAAALALFVISLVAQGIILLFTRAQYAAGNTKIPFRINALSAVITIISAIVLSKVFVSYSMFSLFIDTLFRVNDVSGTLVLMLPLAFSIGSLAGAYAHIFTFDKQYGGNIRRSLTLGLFETTAVAIVMGVTSYFALYLLDNIFDINTFIGIFLQGLLSGLIGIAIGIVLFKLLKSKELEEIESTLHRKFWRTPVVGPDPEDKI